MWFFFFTLPFPGTATTQQTQRAGRPPPQQRQGHDLEVFICRPRAHSGHILTPPGGLAVTGESGQEHVVFD